MSLYLMLLRAGARHRWRSWLALTLLTVVVVGLVLAGAETARRTATAFPRFVAAHGYDEFVYGDKPLPHLAALPEVASVVPIESPAAGPPTCRCTGSISANDFSVQEVTHGQLSRVVKLVSGHLPDQSDPGQVLASTNLGPFGIHVGTVVHVALADTSQRAAVLSNADITPRGPSATLRVVGTAVSEFEFPTTTQSPSYDLYATDAFDRRVDPHAVVFDEYFVRLRHGNADRPRFEAQAQAAGALGWSDGDSLASTIATSIDPQAVGWWILTALTALVGGIVLAQALARQALIESEEYPSLGALGAHRRQLFALTMARTLLLTVVGACGGVVLAFSLSSWTPLGEAALADPSPGLDFDAPLLLGGAALATLVVMALAVWPAVRASRLASGRVDRPVTRPSRVVRFVSASGAPPSALIGVRNALERGRGRNAVPVSSALVGAVLAVAVLSGTAVFSASLTHLTGTPSQYGQGFSGWFSVNDTGSVAQNEQLLAALKRPGISGILGGVAGAVTIDGSVVDALAGQTLRGSYLMTTTSGRPPNGPHDVLLGTKTLQQLGVHVGSNVSVDFSTSATSSERRSFRVVGTTVLPPDFNDQSLGTGAIFSLAGFLGERCPTGVRGDACLVSALSSRSGSFLVRAAPGARGRAAMTALSRAYPSQVNLPRPPTDLVNFGEAVNFPLIFGLVVAVFGVATLSHLLLTSVSRRRRETGLLKSLGMVRRQIALSATWQTTTIAVIGIVLGAPLGIAAGRAVWTVFATNVGVAADPVVTLGALVGVALGVLLVANALAVVPAIVAARAQPASLLRAE